MERIFSVNVIGTFSPPLHISIYNSDKSVLISRDIIQNISNISNVSNECNDKNLFKIKFNTGKGCVKSMELSQNDVCVWKGQIPICIIDPLEIEEIETDLVIKYEGIIIPNLLIPVKKKKVCEQTFFNPNLQLINKKSTADPLFYLSIIFTISLVITFLLKKR